MDPRVTALAADIRLQSDYSLRCYLAYLRLQQIRDTIESRLGESGSPAARVEQLRALRGSGLPGLSDPLYGSITATPPDRESVVGLQRKLLFLLTLVQGADARPTSQTMEAVERLEVVERALIERWQELAR